MPGRISPHCRIFPMPAGVADGYKNGYKTNTRLLQPTTYSYEFECYYSKLCRFFHAGMLEEAWRYGICAESFTKQWRNIQSDAIVSCLRAVKSQLAQWTEDESYSEDDPIRLWYCYLTSHDEALEQTNAFMRERAQDTGRSTLYTPQTYLGPTLYKGDPTIDPYSLVQINYVAAKVGELTVTNANFANERAPQEKAKAPQPQGMP